MTHIKQTTLSGRLYCVAIDPGGDYAIAAVEGGLLVRLDGETLESRGTFALPTGLDQLPPGTTVRPRETRVAFLDARTLLVARVETLSEPEGSHVLGSPSRTRLLAIDTVTGDLRGDFQINGCVLRTDPVPIPPHHVLLSDDGLALVCVDAFTWREVARMGERPEDHDPAVDIEKEIAENGVAYDPSRGLVHVLWRYFNAGVVQSYRFEPDRTRFVSASRGPTVEGHDAGLEANGLCVRPDGSEVAAWFAISDAVVKPRTTGPLGLRMARLGRLGLFSGDGARFLDVESEMDRDLLVSPDPVRDGSGEVVGERVGVDFYEARPLYLDDGRVLLNTPSGFLLGVDTQGGRTEVLHDFRSPVVCLELHREARLLLVGCEDRSVHLMRL